METIPRSREWFQRVERRIAVLTLGIGVITALIVAAAATWRWGAGILLGAALAWVNFRWLEQGLEAISRLARAQSGAPKPRISLWVWIKVFSRYGLIAILLYTAWGFLHIPVVSMLAGLCALGAAVMVEGIYEVIGRPA
jgi:small-conductance mechanosensitive channel